MTQKVPRTRKFDLLQGGWLMLALLWAAPLIAAEPVATLVKDIEFGRVGTNVLRLDLYRSPVQKGPLIVWVHGGAWRTGSKDEMPLRTLADEGWPCASVDYRLSPVARFPAQAHDIKAAIRFLRASAEALQIDASRIVIAGASAGGHLAALVGVSNGNPELEGEIGGNLKESSSVQGIMSFYGAANLTTILAQSTPHGLSMRIPALELLLGGQPDQQRDLARLASPVFHVDKSDPPLLLMHGDQDPQMPINQSHELEGAYAAAGLPVHFEVVHGAGHGGPRFSDAARLAIIRQFLLNLSRD